MTPFYLVFVHDALVTVYMAMFPSIVWVLAIGFVTAFLQSAFQIEDATFNLMPKMFLMVGIGVFGGFGGWVLLRQFIHHTIEIAPYIVRHKWN